MSEPQSKLDQLIGATRVVMAVEPRAVTLTLLVVDVAASEGYFDRTAGQPGLLERYERMGTRAVDGYGGRVVHALGDTLLAEFTEPANAVQAAVHLQRRLAQLRATLPPEEQIQLRMGVASGPCFRAGSELHGEGVERAAAICKRAGPAQVLLTQEMREAVAGHREITCLWIGAFRTPFGEENLFEAIWTEAEQYAEMRHNTTVALRKGDLRIPGLQLQELAQPEPAPASLPPVREEVVGQRTGEFVPMVPASLGRRYDIRGELGRGGMGVVYKAFDRETEEMVALKVLRGEIAADETALVRFRNEVRVARRITHRNVCRIHDFNRTEDAAYISMEFIEGRSLRQMILETGGLGLEQGLPLARQICEGLAEAHRQGVVHRDLKPENVMVDRDSTVRLLDFGIARSALGAGVTQTGAVMGTPAYMAPEQAEGHVDRRSDIYALGLILYEMFTGTPTFRAPTPIAVVMKHIQEIPTPPRNFKPNIPVHIERTILRCLAKKPDDRFQSVSEVAEALEGRIEAMAPDATADVQLPSAPAAPQPAPAATRQIPTVPMRTVEPEAAPAPATAGRQTRAMPQVPAPPVAAKSSAATMLVIIAVVLVAFVGLGAAALWYFKPWTRFFAAPQPESAASTTPATAPPSPSGSTTPASTQPNAAQPATTGAVDLQAPSGLPAPSEKAGPPADTAGAPPPAKAKSAEPPPPALPPVNLNLAYVAAISQRGAINSVAFSPDGRLVVTAGQDTTVGVWDASSGRQIHKMRGHTGAVLGVAFSRDGSRVASASQDRTARIWSVGAGTEQTVLPRENTPVLRVTFSADGQMLATALGDGRIRLWEAGTGAPLQDLQGHSGPVFAIAFSPSGRTLISGGRDGSIRLWDVTNGQERASLRGHSGPVSSVAVSADGRWIASAGQDGAVKVWEAASGRETASFSPGGAVDAVAIAPDGRWVVAGGADKILRAWELPSGRELLTLDRHIFGVTGLALNPGARWLASADSGGNVLLWRWR